MQIPNRPAAALLGAGLVAALVFIGCGSTAPNEAPAAGSATTEQQGGQEEFGPYEIVENWPQPLADGPDGVTHAGWTWGSVGAIYAETPDRIWIAQRGELPLPAGTAPWTPYGMLQPSRGNATGNPDGLNAECEPTERRGWERRWHHVILVVDRDGKMVDWWQQHDKLFDRPCGRGPHKIKMNPYDPDRHVWLIDDQLHVIHKFTYDGQLVTTMGTLGQRGREAGKLFDRPTDIAWLPDGTFFITDGYGGTRVAKFDPDGNFLMDWGQPPADPKNPGPNEWNTVHSIAISDDRRLFVMDRNHRRMQVFDENGKFLELWSLDDPGGFAARPYTHLITTDQHIWVGEGGTNRILKYDLDGRYLYGWGAPGSEPGLFNGPHAITVDQDGNFYVAEVFGGRVQKFRPKPNADPAKMVGQELRYGATSE
jgi:hypothetical protein